MSAKTVIKLDHVQQIFFLGPNQSVRVFEDLNLEIMEGEFVTVVGQTGSGKTTLVNMIAGFQNPTKGRVFVDGTDITKLSIDETTEFRAQRMGIAFQTPHLIPDMTTFENVELPLAIKGETKKKRGELVDEALKIVGGLGFADRKTSNLSVGEKMRVEIARALVTDPPILIMDEPIENLDPLSKEIVLMILRGGYWIQGKTVVVTSHSKKMINAASRVIQLKSRLDL